MCGGVRFAYNEAQHEALQHYYHEPQIAAFAARGVVESVFWQPLPVLPMLRDGDVTLVPWGNRDKRSALPATGWMRNESLLAGKWDRWRPHAVVIPAFQGVEKQIWFDIDQGIQGYAVRYLDVEYLYMLTYAANPAFQALTGHDRMPALLAQSAITPVDPHLQQPGLL